MPPPTEPISIATPVAICPLENTASKVPLYPVDFKASTSQASVAPEKNVKPRPRRADTTAHAQNGAEICHNHRYISVVAINVNEPSRNDARLPHVSATMP